MTASSPSSARVGGSTPSARASSATAASTAPADVGYVNAHATGTPAGDRAEAAGIASVWRAGGARVAVSSTKGHVGHLLGAAGAVEAALALLALAEGVLPPTRALDELDAAVAALSEDAGGPLRLLRAVERAPDLRAVLSNSFGFGGTNASLLFAKAE